jgi:hypothetical protein
VHRYDQVSTFRWRALFNLFANCWRTGKLRIPESAIEGTWKLKLSASGSLQSISERTWLIPLFQQLRVKNRRLAKDMLLWMEVKQPAGLSFTEWDRTAIDTLKIGEVPGMGQFDVDGLDEAGRDDVYSSILFVMGFVTIILLCFGLSYALVLSSKSSTDFDLLLMSMYD